MRLCCCVLAAALSPSRFRFCALTVASLPMRRRCFAAAYLPLRFRRCALGAALSPMRFRRCAFVDTLSYNKNVQQKQSFRNVTFIITYQTQASQTGNFQKRRAQFVKDRFRNVFAATLSPLRFRLCCVFAAALTTLNCGRCAHVAALLPLSFCSYALVATDPKNR